MTTLKRRHAFKRWVPDLGENRELPEREQLALDLAVHLTLQQMEDLNSDFAKIPDVPMDALRARFDAASTDEEREAINRETSDVVMGALARARTQALEPYVRIVGGPHTVNGTPLETVGDYVLLAQTARDGGTLMLGELLSALRAFNSLRGPDELFSLRRSGGSVSTGTLSVVKAAPTTEGR